MQVRVFPEDLELRLDLLMIFTIGSDHVWMELSWASGIQVSRRNEIAQY
jgi:hypothetical protein